jgi:hypothetical protein
VGVLSFGEDGNVCIRVRLEEVAWARGTNGGRPTKAKAGLGWAGGTWPIGRVEVAAWRGNGGGPAGENGLGLIGQPGQKYSRIRKRI